MKKQAIQPPKELIINTQAKIQTFYMDLETIKIMEERIKPKKQSQFIRLVTRLFFTDEDRKLLLEQIDKIKK